MNLLANNIFCVYLQVIKGKLCTKSKYQLCKCLIFNVEKKDTLFYLFLQVI